MHVLMASSAVFFIFLLILLTASSDPTQDIRNALTTFITKIPHASRYNWNRSQPMCTWNGVVCDTANSSVIQLRLPAAGLVGKIPPLTIGAMTSLRVLSLHTNRLSGPLPDDFANLTKLKNVNLGNNRFSGPFPSSVTNWTNLVQLDLSNNNFTGTIPSDINNLKYLQRLQLQNNMFDGRLPDKLPSSINADSNNFSVSNNSLSGPIPQSLIRFPKKAFTGNVYLCGEPLPPCNGSLTLPPSPSPSPGPSESVPKKEKSSNLSSGAKVAIAVGSPLTLLVLLSFLGKKMLLKLLSRLGKKLLRNLLSCLGKKRSRTVKEKKAQAVAKMTADEPVTGWGEDLLT